MNKTVKSYRIHPFCSVFFFFPKISFFWEEARRVEMVMHAMQMIDNREWSEMHATAGKERETSAGHLVKTRAWPSLWSHPRTCVREWSQYNDESEWSLIISLMCPFCLP